MNEQDQVDKCTVAYEVVGHRLSGLWSAIDAVDAKTNITLGFASTIVVIIAGFYSLEVRAWPAPSLVLFGLALIAYILLVVLSLLSYRIRGWSYRPDPSTLIKHCLDDRYSTADIKHWVAEECRTALDANNQILNKKASLTNCVLIVLALETILLVSGLAYGLLVS